MATPGSASPVASATLRLLTLLHDAHEAYTGDFPTPVKHALRQIDPAASRAIKALQAGTREAVHTRFGLPVEPDGRELDLVHRADMLALAIERRDFMAPGEWEWDASIPAAPAGYPLLKRLNPALAEFRFQKAFHRFMAEIPA